MFFLSTRLADQGSSRDGTELLIEHNGSEANNSDLEASLQAAENNQFDI